MALAEFVNDWNEVISFKIKVAHLTKPDQEFLTNALLAYLQELNCDTGPLYKIRYSETYEDRRRFKLYLRRVINNIYKVVASAAPENEFYLSDLIKPTPKKTTEVLRFLLNYLLFHNQLQKEISMDDKIRERDEKLIIKKKLQTEIEKETCNAENIEKRIIELTESLPQFQAKNDISKEKHLNLFKSIQVLEKSQEEHDLELIQLKQKHNELTEKVITEDQISKILSKKSMLENALKETIEISKIESQKKIECDSRIQKLKVFTKQISQILTHLPSEESVQKKKLINSQFKDLSTKQTYQKKQNNEIINLIQEKKTNLKIIDKKIKKCREEKTKQDIDFENQLKEIDSKIHIAKNEIEKFYEKLQEDKQLIEEQTRIKANIHKATEVFAESLSTSFN